jgi:septal ring factor EnvC (AmiA/AmiB activator)
MPNGGGGNDNGRSVKGLMVPVGTAVIVTLFLVTTVYNISNKEHDVISQIERVEGKMMGFDRRLSLVETGLGQCSSENRTLEKTLIEIQKDILYIRKEIETISQERYKQRSND